LHVDASTLNTKSGDRIAISEVTESAVPDFIESIGPRYSIYPAAPFGSPQRVCIPVPGAVEPNEVVPHLYIANEGWYPATQVDGWLVPDTLEVSTVNGVPCVTFEATFGGIVQLGYPALQAAYSESANWAGGLPIAVAALALLVSTARRRSR
jgi:hypothetical protein